MSAHSVAPGRIALITMLSIVAGSFVAPTASGQILRGIGRKATEAVERKANQKVDQKIDEAAQKLVDNSFDSVFGSDDKSGGSSSNGKSGGSSRVFAMLPNAPTEDRYDFDAVFTYEVENIRKGKPADDKGLIVMHFNSDGKYTGTRIASAAPKKDDGEVFAIFDVKNESMVMLMTSDKEKMSMAYSWKEAARYSAGAAPSSGGMQTTGATVNAGAEKPMTFSSLGKKNIAGYSAEGYKGENVDGEVEVWVSNDPKIAYSRMMGASSSMKQMRGVMPGTYPTGMLMEVLSTDRKSGDKGRMTIRSIDTNAKVRIEMSDYPRLGKSK